MAFRGVGADFLKERREQPEATGAAPAQVIRGSAGPVGWEMSSFNTCSGAPLLSISRRGRCL